jgi:hypothetical protein
LQVCAKNKLPVKIEKYPIYISGKRVTLFTIVIAAGLADEKDA